MILNIGVCFFVNKLVIVLLGKCETLRNLEEKGEIHVAEKDGWGKQGKFMRVKNVGLGEI